MDMRIFERVEATGVCWLWTGGTNNCGYGQTSYEGRNHVAHRAVYMTLVGPIPKGLQLDHLCNVRLCVNPDHLEPVTKAENMRRAGMRNGWVEGGKPTRKHPSEYKVRPNVLTSTHCKHGHELATVGVYTTVVRTTQQSVSTCLACKKHAQCKHNHKKTGCTSTCELQMFPREVRLKP